MRKILGLFLLALASTAFAASFDCSKSMTNGEKIICSNSELSALDEQLAEAYQLELMHSTNPNQLKSEQVAWIKQRDQSCEDLNCFLVLYKNRINDLTGASSGPTLGISSTNSNVEEIPAPVEVSSQQVKQTAESYSNHEAGENVSTQSAPIVSSGQNKESMASDAAEVPGSKVQDSQLKRVLLKLLGVALIVNAITAIYLHRRGRLVIYSDYTDAVFTGLVPIAAIVSYFLALFLEVPGYVSGMIAICVFLSLMFFVIKATARSNNGLSIFFTISLVSKITLVGFYYAVMMFLISVRGSSPRSKGESYAGYAARQRREARANATAMIVATAVFVAVSAWVCEKDEFTPIGDYF